MSMRNRILSKIQSHLSPTECCLTDESAQHNGHAGAKPDGETHFKLRIVSRAFEGLPRLERHRLIYDILKEEMQERIHALSLETLTREESQ